MWGKLTIVKARLSGTLAAWNTYQIETEYLAGVESCGYEIYVIRRNAAMSILTVVIATYNRRELLNQTLQSLIGQSYRAFHVIVVDHGSTDHPEEISQKYERDLNLTHYAIERENYYAPGVPKDFGVRKAETPLILFLDTGAIAPPWFIEAHVTFQQTHPTAVGVGLQHGYRSLDAQSGYQQEAHGSPTSNRLTMN